MKISELIEHLNDAMSENGDMEHEMNKLGWRFAGTAGGRLVWRGHHHSTLSFKSWADVKEFVQAQKSA